MEDQTELPLGHEFEPPPGIAMTDPAYDACAHRADTGTLCGEPEGAHDAATAWAYDSNVISWDWKQQPDLDALSDLLEPLGVTLTKIDTGQDEYAIRITGTDIIAEFAAEAIKAIEGQASYADAVRKRERATGMRRAADIVARRKQLADMARTRAGESR